MEGLMTTIPDLDDPIVKHIRTDFVSLNADQTVAEALAQVRANPPEGRIIYFYAVDADNRLVGVVPTRRLLLNQPDARLSDIMIRRLITLPSTATVMNACEFFTVHKLLAFPVVDEHRHLLGIVDVGLYTDELSDLGHQTSHDDLFQLIGVHAEQARMGSPLIAFRVRFPWLITNIVGGILAAFLAGVFQDVLDRLVILALFIPVVLALSESVGIQSVSLATQSLRDNIRLRDALPILRRELSTGLLLGFASGPLVALSAWLWKGQGIVAFAILLSIGTAMTASAMIGVAVPVALRLMKLDPRVAAGPIALVAADLITLMIYFNLARFLLL
jgi:magnesium transporter